MINTRKRIHATFVLALPIIVAWFGWDVAAAMAAVLLALVWRWAIVMSGILAPEKTPRIILETISASHYVEKVRWCMDRLKIEYVERQCAGVIGVFFTGRTVPQLKVRTGLVQSTIGNSPDILRYLWATHCAIESDVADFLKPTAERLELEKRLDRYGRDLQVWIYFHILNDRELTLHAWGSSASLVPRWQRAAVFIAFPLLAALIRRSFSITPGHYEKVVTNIDALLSEVDERLADEQHSILGGAASNYTDLEFAAMTGLWLQPPKYGGGMAQEVRLEQDRMPPKMRSDIERWIKKHPTSITFTERLYAEER